MVGGGFLGCHVAAGLLSAGVSTKILTRSFAAPTIADRVSAVPVVWADARDTTALEEALVGAGHVVWCVGGLLPHDSTAEPTRDLVEALGPLLATLEALRARRGPGIIFFSSGGTVYGNPSELPVAETHPTRPLTPYAVSKLAAECYLAMYRNVHGVPSVVLRCGNVYGPGQQSDRSQGLVAAALARVLVNEPIPVFGDGSAVRDYVHVDDVVGVVLALLGRTDTPQVLNVGSGRGTSVLELLGAIREVTGKPVHVTNRPGRRGDVDRIVLDIALLQSLIDYEPLGLHDGLSRTWAALNRAELAAR